MLSILNFAPAIKNVDLNFFDSTDILILNEVEVFNFIIAKIRYLFCFNIGRVIKWCEY